MAANPVDTISTLTPELQRVYNATVAMERKPLQSMTEKKVSIEKKANLYNDLINKVNEVKKALPGVGTPGALREMTFASSDEKVLTGTINKDVVEPGTYNLEVKQLASRATAISNAFPDRETTRVGSGYFSVETPDGETRQVFIDNESGTLDGLVKSINKANIGVKAAVVNDQTDPELPFRLLLTSDKPGANQTIDYPEFYMIDGEEEFFIDVQNPATNAIVKYEGFDIQSSTNELNDLIKGVNLNLKSVSPPGQPLSFAVEADIPKTAAKVKELVDKLNGVFTFVQKETKFDEKRKPDEAIGGEYSLRMTQSRLRDAVLQNFVPDATRAVKSLGDMGIMFNKTGTLEVDEKKLEFALKNHFEEVSNLVSGDRIATGLAPKLTQAINGVLNNDSGVLTNQKKNFQKQIKNIERQMADKEKIIEKKTETLKIQLSKVQGSIMALQSQSNYLAAAGPQFQGLPKG